MADFIKALNYTLPWEGGYSNHPNDTGGPTNMGITIRTLSEWYGEPATEQDVKDLGKEEAGKIYRSLYWNYDAIQSQAVATKVFDMGVNMGVRRAVRLLQRALNKVGYHLEEDGWFGPKTLNAINEPSLPSMGEVDFKESLLLRYLVEICENYYADIVARNPSQTVFLRGWLRRARSLPTVEA